MKTKGLYIAWISLLFTLLIVSSIARGGYLQGILFNFLCEEQHRSQSYAIFRAIIYEYSFTIWSGHDGIYLHLVMDSSLLIHKVKIYCSWNGVSFCK